jgi:hypothetical protein
MDGLPQTDKKSATDVHAQRRNYTRALISEIRLLVRAVSNSPSMRVSNLKFNGKLPSECVGKPASETSARELNASEIIDEISKVENQIDQRSGIANIGFLQLVRDALVSMTEPETGLTIAYTHLVAGEQRSQPAESGYALAEQAYGLLLRRAKLHRRMAFFLTFIAMLVTFFAAWEATKVSLGKNLLQNLDLLQAQQTVISAEKLKLELVLDKTAGDSEFQITSNDMIPLHAVPLCDRYLLRESMTTIRDDLKKLRFEASPAERELCG